MPETPKQKKINDFLEQVKEEQKTIDMKFFKEYFDFSVPTALAKNLYETKNKNKNNELVN